MTTSRLPLLLRVLSWLAGLLVLAVTVRIVAEYPRYWPPDFESDFLRGREGYFFGSYRWVFYPHIVAGPCTLVFGVLLVSDAFRRRFPRWHRYLGRWQVANVLFVIAPSGLWMAWYAAAGPVAVVSFVILALLTGLTTLLGWRAAMQRRFAVHRHWMLRSFLLLCSAVVLRVSVGMALVLQIDGDGFDPLISWASWLVPLGVLEAVEFLRRPKTPLRHAAVQ